MDKSFSKDNIEAFQLKECYELSIKFEKLDIAQEVLRKRSKRLDISMNYTPVQVDAPYQETEMQVVSKAIYELALEGITVPEKTSFKYAYKIDGLSNSAEKEFVLALLSLRNGTNETQIIDALRHISAALNYSPNDPRFITLAQILQEAGNK